MVRSQLGNHHRQRVRRGSREAGGSARGVGRSHVDDIADILVMANTRVGVTAICAVTVCADLLSQVEPNGTRAVIGCGDASLGAGLDSWAGVLALSAPRPFLTANSFLRRGVQDGPVQTHAVTVLARSHEISEGVAKLCDLHPTLVLAERNCGPQRCAELVGALCELSRRLDVKHGAALLRGELIKQQA